MILIHGMWLHVSSWEAWAARFSDHGYAVSAPAWPGEPATVLEARRDPAGLRGLGIGALTEHYERIVRSYTVPPILIGHSVGGLIAQRLLGENLGRAAVAIAPAPIDGAVTAGARPRLGTLMPTEHNGFVPLPPTQFRHIVANTVGEQEASALFERYVVLTPRRLVTDLGLDGAGRGDAPDPAERALRASSHLVVDTGNASRGPLLLISGQEDCLVPDAVTRSVYKLYGDSAAVSDLKQFADRGHSLVIDSGWRAVADHVLAWLAGNGIAAALPA